MGNKRSDFVGEIYQRKTDFIVIGITGWTGSGCTSVADLLTQSFDEWKLPPCSECSLEGNEKRKYNIIYKYAESHFKRFTLIRMKDVITLFLLLNSLEKFRTFIEPKCQGYPTNKYKLNEETKNLILKIQKELKEEYRIENMQKLEKMHKENKKEQNQKLYTLYFKKLIKYTDELEEAFNNIYIYKKIFKEMADNIRSSGNPFDTGYIEENIFKISNVINNMIKVLRHHNDDDDDGGKVLVVIDGFRNPYDVTFFKDRYSAFYLFSVNSNKSDRIKRLINDGFNKNQIDELDKKDEVNDSKYPSECYIFCKQDIEKCIELSDVYLYNPYDEHGISNVLKEQLIRYVSLIMHPGLITPTHIERCMQIAYNAKVNSGCLSRQVGAVITDDNFVIKSIGWNDVPEGQVSCNLRDIEDLDVKRNTKYFSEYELYDEEFKKMIKHYNECIKDIKSENRWKIDGRLIPYCFKDIYNGIDENRNQVHTRSLHAEENAFLQICKYGGMGLKDGYLFTTASPCELCAKKSYQIGIKKIYYIDLYPGISENHILKNGKNIPKLEQFQGAIGRAYTQMYTQILPLKDELYMLLEMKFKKTLKEINGENEK